MTRICIYLMASLALVGTVACGGGGNPSDAGFTDGDRPDTRVDDGAVMDDGSVSDGGATDGGATDGGRADSAMPADSGTMVVEGTRPRIYNFRTDDAHRDRLYFDSYGDITGLTLQGFVVSGKTISAVDTASNYFTVSPDFTYWDNNTIRLGEIDNSVVGDGTVYDFELQYIVNNIAEPSSTGTTYYTNAAVASSGDGSSEAQAFKTVQEGVSALSSPGDVLYVKAGDYGAENVNVSSKTGTIDNPIRILGYQTTPGDTPSPIFNYPDHLTVDPAVMPTLTNTVGTAITVRRCRYFMFKNFQTNGGSGDGIYITGGTRDAEFENLIFRGDDARTNGLGVNSNNAMAEHLRLLNTKVYNHGISKSVSFPGYFNLVDDLNIIVTSVGGNYTLYTTRSDSIFRHVRIETHTEGQHGISVKGDGSPTEHNLIEHCYVEGQTAALEARHHEVRFNVYRDIEVRGIDFDGNNGVSAINLWGGSYNVFDRITGSLTRRAIYHLVNRSDDGLYHAGVGNIVKNSNFYRDESLAHLGTRTVGIYYQAQPSTPAEVIRGNKVINCNFYGLSDFEEVQGASTEVANEVTNCNIVNLYGANETSTTIYTNSNFYNNAFPAPVGTNMVEVDPSFTDPATYDFSFSASTPMSIYDGGADNDEAHYGYAGVPREPGMFSIGAYERD